MKKLGLFTMMLVLAALFTVKPAEAAYLKEHDKYVEVTAKEARKIADLMGLKDVPLGEETAKLSFELQEKIIAEIEKISGKEIDHYYIWLTINGEPVLGIDPPMATF
ncbi:8-amino-7-oxononanoate synthase [Bacillus sp. M6-12]|uniref:8-amino-7-oxononanoate synthase n=1 Tax=Bacillus sp. M6-12 TaxID=2054166 RepID=UPI000C761D32|nr:8-amino-7-oxononanoate synthase [Bacillus sp. M6-12]PLS17107.1 8-amino-7-oxononanoate synthase [Bacillus sp. M6-12]